MLSSSPEVDWSWSSTLGVVRFVWNCSSKYIYGQRESTYTSCSGLGDYNIEIDVTDSRVTFTDDVCAPIFVNDNIGASDVYLFVGADQDTAGRSAEWYELNAYAGPDCTE